MPIDKTYAKKVYDSLRDDVEGFDKDEATFYKLIETDKNYLKNVHLTLKDVYGDDFDKDESMFESALGLKKKEPAIGLGYEKPSEALRMGGLPKQEKLSQSPLKTAGTTTPSVSTKSALQGIKGTSTPPTGVTKIKTTGLPSESNPYKDQLQKKIEILNQKFGTDYDVEGALAEVDAPDIGTAEAAGRGFLSGVNNIFAAALYTPEYLRRIFTNPIMELAGMSEEDKQLFYGAQANNPYDPLFVTNKLSEYYKGDAEKITKPLKGQFDKDFFKQYEEGDYLGAAKQFGVDLAQSIPATIGIAAATAAGVPQVALMPVGSLVFASQNYQDIDPNSPMTETAKQTNSFLKGFAEQLFENLGTSKLTKQAMALIEREGVDNARAILAKQYASAAKEALKPYFPLTAPLQEGLTEGGTAMAQNVIDMLTDPSKKNINIMDNVVKSTVMGTGMGVAFGGAPTVINAALSLSGKKKAKEIGDKLAEIDKDLDNEKLSDQVKGLLVEERAKSLVDINNVLEAENNKFNELPEEVKTQVQNIQQEISAIDDALNSDITETAKQSLEAKKNELTTGLDNLIKTRETTKDGEGTIEGAVSTGTDVAQEGLGVANEPSGEGVTGEGVQAETVPQAPLDTQQVPEVVSEKVTEVTAPAIEVTPTAETKPTTKPLAEQIADLRAKEQAEYDAMVDPNDTAGREKIYDKYDKLITPLIREQKAKGSVGVGGDVKLEKPSAEQQLKDIQEGNTVTFEYKNENEVPEVFKDKISSKGEINGKPYVKVTMAKSLGDYHLQEQSLKETQEAKPTKPAAKVEPVKEAAKPTKTERKAIAEAKIDDLAAKAKEFLRNKNLPEGTQVSGISQNKVIDLMASTVKALVNSGIEIAEAIKQVREFFEQEYDTSAVKDYQIAQAIARDELTDVAKENGFSSYREAVFAVNKYVREVGKEDVITKAEIEKAAVEAKKAKSSEKKGFTGKKKVSKFYQTALAYVQNTPARLQDFLKANPLSYGVVSNEESIKKGIEYIEKNGFEETINAFLAKRLDVNEDPELVIFIAYLLRGGLSDAFTDISRSMNNATDTDELAALKEESDKIFNYMKDVTVMLADFYFPSFGRAIQAGALFARDLSTEDGAIFHFTKLTEEAAKNARTANLQQATEQVDTVNEVVEEGKAQAAKEVTEYIVKSKDVQARNTTKLSKARKAAADAREKLKAALAKYKILGIANDPWQQAKNDVATVKALTNYVAAQLKYKSVQASQIVKEIADLLGINARYVPKSDIQDIMDAAKVQAEKDMTFDEITNVTTPKGTAYAERVGKELSKDPSAINKTVESIIEDYYMGNQTLDEIVAMVKQRFDVTDAQAITIAKKIQDSINNNITKNLEKQLNKKIKQLNDKRLKEESNKPAKERKPVKSLYDIMAQAQIMGVLDTDSVQAILEELYNVPTVTPEDIQFVKDTYAKINNTGDLTRKAQLIADLHKRFASKNPISFSEVYEGFWYSSVLSGPSTTDVNIKFGIAVFKFALADAISGTLINTAKIIADKFKGKQSPSSIALEANILLASFWRAVFQVGVINIDSIKRGILTKKESLPFYESAQNLASTLLRGPQAINEELRNTDIKTTDAYFKNYVPTKKLAKILLNPLVWIDKATNLLTILTKGVPRVINAVDIFFGTAIKNINLAQVLRSYYISQGLSGKELATAIKSDLNRSIEQLRVARDLAANDRLNIDLEIKQENGEFVVYDTGKKKKSFPTRSAAKAYMIELSSKGDKFQKGVVDYLNSSLPLDVIDASRRVAAQYVCTGAVEGRGPKFIYGMVLQFSKKTMEWSSDKPQGFLVRAAKFAVSKLLVFTKYPLNFINLALEYTPALVFFRSKYTGNEASFFAQVYKEKAQQRFLTGFVAFLALTTPKLLSMLILKSPDDEEEENKEDLKRREELAKKMYEQSDVKKALAGIRENEMTGTEWSEKLLANESAKQEVEFTGLKSFLMSKSITLVTKENIQTYMELADKSQQLFALPKDGEIVGSLSFLPPGTKKFLKENNLAVPFHTWDAKAGMWKDWSISPNMLNTSFAAAISDYVKYVINDKTKFNSAAQRAKELQNVAFYVAGNLVQTSINTSGFKSQNQLLLTLNSGNYERVLDAVVDLTFSSVQTTPALMKQVVAGLEMRLRERVEFSDKPFAYVASKTIPLGGLFFLGDKKYDMFGDEIAYLAGADRGFVLAHLFSYTQEDYEANRSKMGEFLLTNGYSKYRDFVTEYKKKNTEIIDVKNPVTVVNGLNQTNYLDEGFTDKEMGEIGLAAARRAKQVLIDNMIVLKEIGSQTNLEAIPLISADYTIPFTEAIDKIYDIIFEEEWKSALVKKNYVNKIGAKVYKAEEVLSKVIPIELEVIRKKITVETKIPVKAKIPIEFQDLDKEEEKE